MFFRLSVFATTAEGFSLDGGSNSRGRKGWHHKPAALKANIKITKKLPPRIRAGIGPNHRFSLANGNPEPPPDAPGERRQEQNKKRP